MTELKLQQQCFLWFNANFPEFRRPFRLFRIKNELDNHPRKSVEDKIKQISENKATGVNKGIADFVFIDKIGDSHWIELKVEDGKQSPEQKDFQAIVKNYYICFSLNEFQNIMKKITLILVLAILAVSCTKETTQPETQRVITAENFKITGANYFQAPGGSRYNITYTFEALDTSAIEKLTVRFENDTFNTEVAKDRLKNGKGTFLHFRFEQCNCYDYTYTVAYRNGSKFTSEPKRPL